jgi:hypothetical protein
MDTYFFIVLYSLKITRPFHDKRYSIVVQFRFKKNISLQSVDNMST